LYESVTKLDEFQLFLLNLICKVCIPNARCALSKSRNDPEGGSEREQAKLVNSGARSAQSLKSAKFEETTKKNARWA
jgi:hypothetical protein